MTSWRTDSNLKDRFHPDYPDDLQVVVHEGSFRFTETKPEIMWAKITGEYDLAIDGHQVYQATLLNQPHQLKTLKADDSILLVGYKDYPYTLLVTPEYVKERQDYIVKPCNGCNLPEAFDPISQLIEHSFRDMPKEVDGDKNLLMVFTSFCPMCGQMLFIRHKDIPEESLSQKPPTPSNMPPQSSNKDSSSGLWDRLMSLFRGSGN